MQVSSSSSFAISGGTLLFTTNNVSIDTLFWRSGTLSRFSHSTLYSPKGEKEEEEECMY
jgi:hypothetical protein